MENIILTSEDNISTNNNEVKFRLPMTHVSKNDKIALAALSLYYSWENITEAFQNTTGCAYTWVDGITYPVVFDHGFYTIEQISDFIKFKMAGNGHFLVDSNGDNVYFISLAINPIYYKVTLSCSKIPLTTLPTGYTNPNSIPLNGLVPQLVLTNTNFGKLIGFANVSFPSTLQSTASDFNSTLTPRISPVTNVFIQCDWVANSKFSKFSKVIQTFVPNVPYLDLINFQPPVPIWYNVLQNTYSDVTISFIDQQGRALTLMDTGQISCTLILAPRDSN